MKKSLEPNSARNATTFFNLSQMHLTRMKWNEVGGGFDGDAARAGRLGIGERQLHTSRSSTRPLCMHVTGSGDLSLNCRRPSSMM